MDRWPWPGEAIVRNPMALDLHFALLRSLQEPARSTTASMLFFLCPHVHWYRFGAFLHTGLPGREGRRQGVKPLSELTTRGRASRMPLWSFCSVEVEAWECFTCNHSIMYIERQRNKEMSWRWPVKACAGHRFHSHHRPPYKTKGLRSDYLAHDGVYNGVGRGGNRREWRNNEGRKAGCPHLVVPRRRK